MSPLWTCRAPQCGAAAAQSAFCKASKDVYNYTNVPMILWNVLDSFFPCLQVVKIRMIRTAIPSLAFYSRGNNGGPGQPLRPNN